MPNVLPIIVAVEPQTKYKKGDVCAANNHRQKNAKPELRENMIM